MYPWTCLIVRFVFFFRYFRSSITTIINICVLYNMHIPIFIIIVNTVIIKDNPHKKNPKSTMTRKYQTIIVYLIITALV